METRVAGFDYGQNAISTMIVGCSFFHEDAAASQVVSVTAIRLSMIVVRNLNAADRWFMIFNAAALPADTSVPNLMILPLAAGEIKSYAPPFPIFFSTGLVWAMSTTDTQLTVSATADGEVDTFVCAPG